MKIVGWLVPACPAREPAKSVRTTILVALASLFFIWPALTEEAKVEALVPNGEAVAGWPMVEEVRIFQGQGLFDFINGAAEPFYTYGFLRVATADYQNKDEQFLTVEIYEMDSSANGFGIYSFQRPSLGEKVEIGADCVMAESILYCWKDRYYIKVHTFPDSPAARDAVRAFAEVIAKNIKEEGPPPALLKLLPRVGLIPGSEKFLHQKKVLDNIYFLSRENVLNLSEKTNMALADYKRNKVKFTLFIVEYRDAKEASLARASFEDFRKKEEGRRHQGVSKLTDRFLIGVWGSEDMALARMLDEVASAIKKCGRLEKEGEK